LNIGSEQSKLGVNASNDQIIETVKQVATQNDIAIPEWDIAGSLNSRALSASVLNSLNW